MPSTPRLVAAIALATALAACGHVRQGPLVRSPAEEAEEERRAAARTVDAAPATAPAEPPAAAVPAADPDASPSTASVAAAAAPATGESAKAPSDPAPAPVAAISSPSGERAPASLAETPASPAAPSSTPVRVSSGDRSVARGALKGAGAVLYVVGSLCIAGREFTLLVCAVLVYYGWPYLLGAMALGATIGAALAAPPRPVEAGREPEEPAGMPRGPDPGPLPAAQWGNS